MTPIGMATSAIGMVTSEGDIELGRVRMPGLATLYEGATVETGNSPAQLSLRNGAIVRLGSVAKATVHANSILLERGVGQVDSPGNYAIQARSLTVTPTSHPSRARLQVTGEGTLQVAAISGSFEIRTAGVLSVGQMMAGKSLSFAADSAEAGAEAPSQFKGCLAKLDKGILLHQENSDIVLALIGSSIGGKSGDRVTVVGKVDKSASPVVGASEVVQVLRLTVDGHGCSARAAVILPGSAAAGTAAAGAGAAGAAAGIGTVTAVAAGVGVAAAGTLGGFAATGAFSGTSISPSSRP